MSNLLVKHGRTFSPAKLRNQSKIERLPPRNSVPVKNEGLNRNPVSPRKEHDRKRFVFSVFLDSLRLKAQTQLRYRRAGIGTLLHSAKPSAQERGYLGLSFKTTASAGRFSATTQA
jgi:hypothetical protein